MSPELRSTSDRIPIQVSRGCVVASIQVDLTPAVLRTFREELLEVLAQTGLSGVILDVSGVSVIDSEEFAEIQRITAMAKLMGAESVISGLRPGVVSSLVEIVDDFQGIRAVSSLDDAFGVMEAEQRPSPVVAGQSSRYRNSTIRVGQDGSSSDQV